MAKQSRAVLVSVSGVSKKRRARVLRTSYIVRRTSFVRRTSYIVVVAPCAWETPKRCELFSRCVHVESAEGVRAFARAAYPQPQAAICISFSVTTVRFRSDMDHRSFQRTRARFVAFQNTLDRHSPKTPVSTSLKTPNVESQIAARRRTSRAGPGSAAFASGSVSTHMGGVLDRYSSFEKKTPFFCFTDRALGSLSEAVPRDAHTLS